MLSEPLSNFFSSPKALAVTGLASFSFGLGTMAATASLKDFADQEEQLVNSGAIQLDQESFSFRERMLIPALFGTVAFGEGALFLSMAASLYAEEKKQFRLTEK